ncbi:hypothetical protein BDZ94DRAFT_1308053 [Collybia nuda]|uniref:Uncharacterized protein n=1 Tax=Collybia nuda TaxID=64659 RepID=A0A9P6CL02_9AGAR|nr:hypothetical protein BDZ94DRAFT_1308053 [Collybia nuda]
MDNGDKRSSYLPQHNKTLYNSNLGARHQPHILSRIRNFNDMAMTSIGSLFSTPPSSNLGAFAEETPGETHRTMNNWDCETDLESARTASAVFGGQQGDQNYDDYELEIVDTSTPMPTRSSSPLQLGRFSDVKRIFNNFARSRQFDSHEQMRAQLNTATPADLNLSKTARPYDTITHFSEGKYSTTISCPAPGCTKSEHLATPPLTPDSFDDYPLPASTLSDSPTEIWNELYPEWAKDQSGYYDEDEYPPSNSLEIQEGKRPERPIYHDSSITSLQRSTPAPQTFQKAPQDDEWFGLEYTLELSTRERRPSGAQSFSVGEHSKSRESWAALHQGMIHPFFEDEDYYQWKNWHRYLDRQDERKRHKKGLEFKACSKNLAWYYADEMVTRDVMYWQKEVYGLIAREVKERLETITERRPDPYYPPKKHNRAWYLKRSRSIGSLRELQPVPGHQRSGRDHIQVTNFNEPAIEADDDDCFVFLED